ncbi:MAG: hypothetical protein H7177_06875 [Rhizobacter sp.]|nr:hypothetical protein [Bacteriovorax sp.]
MNTFLSIFLAYAVGTVVEYFFHRFVGHPPKYFSYVIFKAPLFLRRQILQAQSGHAIHHVITAKNYFQTGPELDSEFDYIRRKEKLYPNLVLHNQTTNFGMSFDIYSALSAAILTFPLALIFMLFFKSSLYAAILFPLPLMLIILTSRYIHPLLHMKSETLANHKSIFVSMLAKTSYFKYVQKKHFLHHKQQGLISYNLVPGCEQILEFFFKTPAYKKKQC